MNQITPRAEITASSLDVEQTLDRIAQRVCQMGFSTPALLFLEIHRPLTTLCHTGTLFLAPIAGPLLGLEKIQVLQEILADRKNIDRLIEKIRNFNNISCRTAHQ